MADLTAYAVEMLDEVRRQEQSTAIAKARFMQLGRDHGLTYQQIAEHLDMSASSVKRAIRRAAGTPGMGDL